MDGTSVLRAAQTATASNKPQQTWEPADGTIDHLPVRRTGTSWMDGRKEEERKRGGENVNSQLKAARRARGLAIWGLSVMSGVSPSLLTAIEKWGYVPGADTQQRIADALGLQVDDIWTRETQPGSTSGVSDCSELPATVQTEVSE